jgi:DNA-binding NarL/FixJ family response regulator
VAIARLTVRERDVLTALACGLSDKEIADRLYVSHETVRTHMVNVLGKLGVSSRLQALVFSVRRGLVQID